MKVLSLNETNFDATLTDTTEPVLVDFWAPWCGPCRTLAPVLDTLAGETAGDALVAKVNIEEAPRLTERFGITSIPTLLIFKNGQPVNRFVGVQPKERLRSALLLA